MQGLTRSSTNDRGTIVSDVVREMHLPNGFYGFLPFVRLRFLFTYGWYCSLRAPNAIFIEVLSIAVSQRRGGESHFTTVPD